MNNPLLVCAALLALWSNHVTARDGVAVSPVLTNARAGSPAAAPVLTSFSPSSAAVGARITITGTDFTGATAIRFNGVPAVFTVVDATTIHVTVPAGATAGRLSVTTPDGTATSATDFTPIAVGIAPMLVLSGQSNALGVGWLSDLSTAPLNTITPDMRRTFARTDIFSPYTNRFEALRPGTNNLAASDDAQTAGVTNFPPAFGVETGYPQLWEADNAAGKFRVVKQVHDGGGIDFWADYAGSDLRTLVDRFNAAKAEVTAISLAPAVQAFVWIRGEANSSESTASYLERLTLLLNNLRTAGVLQPATKIILCGVKGGGNTDIAKQQYVAANPTTARFVATTDLPTNDGVHYSAAGMATLSERVYNATYGTNSRLVPVVAGLAPGTKESGVLLGVYPNPSRGGRFTLELSGDRQAAHVTVLNALGEVVFTASVPGTTSQPLNLSLLGAGLYVLRVQTAGGLGTRRVVIH